MHPVGQAEERTSEPATVTRRIEWWRLLRLVLGLQGLFYVITGLWPLVHLRSFVWVFGEQRDVFQRDVTSALTVVIGAVLLLSATRRRPDGLLVGLGAGAALAFMLMELRYRHTVRGTIWLDFAVELLFALALAVVYAAARLDERRRRRA